MNTRPRCTVIVPTYNRVGLLRRTLDSLGRQDLGTENFEVLVVDDGSSDATAELAYQYARRLNLGYFFQPDEGYRVARARNLGIAHAAADVCVFLDSGVLAHSRCLSAHLRHHTDTGTSPAAVIGYVYCFDHDNSAAPSMLAELDFDDPDGIASRLGREGRWLDVREPFFARHQDLNAIPAPWLMYWTCNVSAATAQLRAVGGFDEAFRSWGGEDIDLGYRLHRDGASFHHEHDAAAVHHPHEKDLARNLRDGVNNHRYFALKYDTPITRLLDSTDVDFLGLNDMIMSDGILASAAEAAHASAVSR